MIGQLLPQKRAKAPKLFHSLLEARCLVEPLSLLLMTKALSNLPLGDGHPVLVLPGFSASDNETFMLRQFLASKNYKVYAWKMGRNVGYNAGLEKRVETKVRSLAELYGTKVSIIGWSLGGMFARCVAHNIPEHVRGIITLGTPIKIDPELSSLSPALILLSKAVHKGDIGKLFDEYQFNLWATTPSVPTTAIYSRSDGAVHWRSCLDPLEHDMAQNIRVSGSHCGFSHNALVYTVIADRLAQAIGQWQPHQFTGSNAILNNCLEPLKHLY